MDHIHNIFFLFCIHCFILIMPLPFYSSILTFINLHTENYIKMWLILVNVPLISTNSWIINSIFSRRDFYKTNFSLCQTSIFESFKFSKVNVSKLLFLKYATRFEKFRTNIKLINIPYFDFKFFCFCDLFVINVFKI